MCTTCLWWIYIFIDGDDVIVLFKKKNIVLWMKNKTNYSSFLERRSHSWSRHYISISSVLNQLRERFSRHGLYIAEFFSRSYGDVYLMSTDMPTKLWPQITRIPHVSIVFHSRLFTRKKNGCKWQILKMGLQVLTDSLVVGHFL